VTHLPIFANTFSELWKVLVLFLIPIGGGIPAGVLLASKENVPWPMMMFLYFISDVILACVFEPLLILFIAKTKHNPKMVKFSEKFKEALNKTTEYYGTGTGPFALIMIAFGSDPMTGRTVAVAAGHGFVSGWIIAITGDMLYFTLIMVSTLWLSSILGDGTTTMYIILGAMIIIPLIVKRFRKPNQAFPPQ
jgi:hypothetical protein